MSDVTAGKQKCPFFLNEKMGHARSLHGLCHIVHGLRGHCEGLAKRGPCGEVLAETSSDDPKEVLAWTPRRPFF